MTKLGRKKQPVRLLRTYDAYFGRCRGGSTYALKNIIWPPKNLRGRSGVWERSPHWFGNGGKVEVGSEAIL